MSAQLSHYYRKRAEMIKLLGGECKRCGLETDLQFDHVDPSKKSFNISKCYGLSMDRLLPELDKCQLLCKTCHDIKTRDVDGFKTEHGKYSMYRHGKCRCPLCKEANRVQHADWVKKKKLKEQTVSF